MQWVHISKRAVEKMAVIKHSIETECRDMGLYIIGAERTTSIILYMIHTK